MATQLGLVMTPDGKKEDGRIHMSLNQCDGCRAGIPIKQGVHIGDGYNSRSMCTRDRYNDPLINVVYRDDHEIEYEIPPEQKVTYLPEDEDFVEFDEPPIPHIMGDDPVLSAIAAGLITKAEKKISDYIELRRVLEMAYDQAAKGKGYERHSFEEPFEDQKICEITRRVGMGYPLGQAIKKCIESERLTTREGVDELLGAINYIAAAVIVMQESECK